jgi:hypothetical protein
METFKSTSPCPVSATCSSSCQRTARALTNTGALQLLVLPRLEEQSYKTTRPFFLIAPCSLGELMSEAAMETPRRGAGCVWPAPGFVCQQPARATRQRAPVQVCHKSNDRETLGNICLFLAAHVLRHQGKARSWLSVGRASSTTPRNSRDGRVWETHGVNSRRLIYF